MQCAGIDRHEAGNARVLRKRRSEPLGRESIDPGHVWKLQAREPGDLGDDCCVKVSGRQAKAVLDTFQCGEIV